MSWYQYKRVPLRYMHELSVLVFDTDEQGNKSDAYVAYSAQRETVEDLLKSGYRWIRTEDKYAILELVTSKN